MKSSVQQYIVGLCIHLHKFLVVDMHFIHRSNNKLRIYRRRRLMIKLSIVCTCGQNLGSNNIGVPHCKFWGTRHPVPPVFTLMSPSSSSWHKAILIGHSVDKECTLTEERRRRVGQTDNESRPRPWARSMAKT